jgi:serine/threonine protein kinase
MSVPYAFPDSKRHPIEDDYELKEQLGDGQYSVVKVGVHKLTTEEVAIKIIHRSQTESYEFCNEVELMRQVSDHPGFIKLFDVYEDEKNFTRVMELVRGGELFDKIGQLSTYNEERVAKLLHQIVSALAYLHSKNIVHRDLKPENLLFNDDNATIIKLCDFGVAEKIPERGYLTEIIGTESYMAPEVEDGKPYGVSSDMYGLGVIMYIMLCGYPPFEPENGIVDLEFPEEEWSTISTTVKDLITKLLEHDPNKRPTAQEVLNNPWICGDTVQKEELKDTVHTMKIYNHYRASGNLGSMREAKANKKEAVWSIFANGYSKKPKQQKPPKLKKKVQNPQKKQKKKESISIVNIISPRAPDNNNNNNIKKLSEKSPSFRVPFSKINEQPEGPKASPIDELQLSTITHISRDPQELQITVSLLESKLVSLSNINCALESQIDEISGSFTKLKLERDEIRRTLDEALQEIESYRQKNKKKDKK